MVTSFRSFAFLTLCTALPAVAFAADQARFPSNEDLRHVRSMTQPKLSPDGHSVLVQIADSTADGAKSHLWLVDIRTNKSRQLTWSPASAKRGEFSGQWMPDGDGILFLAHRGDHTQLYRLPMELGEARPYDLKIAPPVDESDKADAVPPRKDAKETKAERLPIDVENYSVSPDGKFIAILAEDPETPGEKKQHDEKADAVWVDHGEHGSRLYLLSMSDEKLNPVSIAPNVESVAWSKQGDRLIAISGPMNGAGDLQPANKGWMVSTNDLTHPTQIEKLPPTAQSGVWSEDGKQFILSAQAEQDAPPGYHDVYALSLADGSLRNLTAKFGGTVYHEPPLTDGSGVLVPVQVGTRLGAMRIDPRSDNAKFEPIPFETATVTQWNTNASHSGWVWIGSSSTQPPALYFAEKPGRSAHTLDTPAMVPANWPSAASQLVSWTNEGLTIEGLLYLPPQAKSGKVPLVVDVHGGPTGAFEDAYYPLIQFLIGQGWAVLRTNPRGSTGYGASFAAANKNDLGGADYRDIMAGVDTVVAKFPVDTNKMGLMGYSYGGEMAGFVEGKTDRFKGVISMAPVIDQFSEYGTEAGSYYDRWFYGYPWDHMADAWKQSPLAGASKAKTPFMLIQGEADRTDPLGQSLEMYRALWQMKVPVEMVQYPREDHGPLAIGIFGNPSPEPWHGFDGRQRIVRFFEKAFGEDVKASIP
ncbi:prolyl oligopeptidase family serine peptidase [Silvibacterium acidisoli]|uniref:prolyl oligopeptidase family serine peptidase n=1 Tax=Acidobacteriaceae bacterium ZG23-2 TaxID=2883246 RepID=UPI00406C112C